MVPCCAVILAVSYTHLQFQILSQETSGTCEVELSFIMVHAQDHLMTAILAKELISEQIEMKKEITALKAEKQEG